MKLSRRGLLGTVAAAAVLPVRRLRAQTPKLKLGVLNDMNGPYRDLGGPASIAGVRQAVHEFLAAAGAPFGVEVVNADHQNKPDIGAGIARQWLDIEGVDAIVDVPNSAVALAVQTIVRDRNKVFIDNGAGSSVLTGAQCSPNMVAWCYDTYMNSHVMGANIVARGGDTWFFILPDYAFGHQLTEETAGAVEKAGGKVLGKAAHAFPETTDFSPFLVQAKTSGAKVLAFANGGTDLINCLKQAREFGVDRSMQIVTLYNSIATIHSVGLEAMQGLFYPQVFYWDANDRTRAFARRALAETGGIMPIESHAGCYGGTLHYLKAAADMGVAAAKADGVAAVNRMKAMPFDNDAHGTGVIREDGRGMLTAYLLQVKKPGESSGGWDLATVIAAIPGERAWRPLAEGHCPFVKL